jgi:uncharacterized protein with FMN-binding domain
MAGKKRGWLIALGVIVVLVGAMAIAATAGMGAVRRTVVADVDMAQVPDGVSHGVFHEGRFQFAVTVEVKDNRIAAISMVDPAKTTDLTRALAAKIIDKQSVEIDAVSGASLTTRAFAKAVENALSAAQAPVIAPATPGTT